MSRNGAGTYNLPAGNPVTTGTTISSTWANTTLSDMASALTQSVAKDGQTVMTANLPMGGFKLTGLGAGTVAGNSLRYEQLFSQGLPTDIASASTVDIGGQNTSFLNVTGTVSITSLGTNYNGPRFLKFEDTLTLTHDATSLQLPDGLDIITEDGDVAIFIPKSTITGVPNGWKLAQYLRNSEVAVNIASASTVDLDATVTDFLVLTGTTTITAWTLTSGVKSIYCPSGIQLTYNATTNKLNTGGTNYTTATGDLLTIRPFGSTITVEISRADGSSINSELATDANDPTYVSDSATVGTSTQWLRSFLDSRRFVSSEQTMTAGGLLTIPHGLGAVPSLTLITLKCTTADGTNSVGDLIDMNGVSEASSQSAGTEIKKDATNLYVRVGTGGIILFNTSGGAYNITLSNYRLIATAQL